MKFRSSTDEKVRKGGGSLCNTSNLGTECLTYGCSVNSDNKELFGRGWLLCNQALRTGVKMSVAWEAVHKVILSSGEDTAVENRWIGCEHCSV